MIKGEEATMSDQFEFEEISLADDEELEEILKLTHGYWNAFPCLTICDNNIYFNVAANGLVPQWIKWFATSELIIGLPSDRLDSNAFAVKNYSNCSGNVTRYPSFMRHKKIKHGVYKLYKYKDGFAFKRYEPIIGRE